jgi:gliding motility-associated-like protein
MVKSNFFFVLFIFLSLFATSQNFQTVGDAFGVSTIQNNSCSNADNCFTLTSNTQWQQGAVWDLDTLDLSGGFDATFCMFIGNSDAGADGFAFLLRGLNSNNYGDNGGGLGYGVSAGNPGILPSVAIEFDTYYNADNFDIQADHTQLVINGAVSSAPAVNAVPLLPNSGNVEDNAFHTSRIVWNPTLQQLQMYFDGNLRFTYNGNIIANVFGGNPLVYWGFTASTGGLTNLQQVCFPKPLIDLPEVSICENDSTLIHFYTANLTSYTWTSPSNEVIINWNQAMATPLIDTSFYATSSGDYRLTVEFNNQFFTAIAHVEVVPLPIIKNLTFCANNNSSTDLFSEFLNLPQDGIWQGLSAVSNGYLGTIIPSNILSGLYTYVSPTTTVCSNHNQVNIALNDLNFNGTVELIPCTETAYDLTVSPFLSPLTANISYNWTSPSANINPNQNSAFIEINANSNVNLAITMAGNPTCIFDTTFNLLFNSQQQLNLGLDRTICEGDDFLIMAQGNWSSYLWNDGETNSSKLINQSGIYWCEVSTLIGNCTLRDSIEIFSSLKPSIFLASFDTISCLPFLLNFEASSDLPNVEFSWYFGDGEFSTNSSQVFHNYQNVGVFSLTIRAIVQATCINELVLVDAIHVINRPLAQFSHEILASSNETSVDIQFFNNSQNYSDAVWTFNNSQSSIFENPLESFSSEINNFVLTELKVFNEYCADSVSKKISFPEKLIYYVPNAFTPDGNMLNNVFKPIITEGMDKNTYHFSLFNRWGQLLFESFDTEIGWDGTYGGKLVQNGLYIWKISFNSNLDQKSVDLDGHVQVLR